MLIGGNNIGRIGVMESIEKHPGSFDIAHVKDTRGQKFSTRLANVFVIGDGKTPAISIPKGDGIKYSNIEERDMRMGIEEDDEAEDDE